MVHEKQTKNEESAVFLNQNTDTGAVPRQASGRLISTPLAYARGTVPCLMKWRLLEILASIL